MVKSKGSPFNAVASQPMTLRQHIEQRLQGSAGVQANSTGTDADKIPDWFADRNRVGGEQIYTGTIARETEKAVLISGNTISGRPIEMWVPKSVLQTPGQQSNDRLNKQVNRELNMRYSSYLKQTAQQAGVKVGNLSSWDKIKAKLDKNGISYLDKEQFGNQPYTN